MQDYDKLKQIYSEFTNETYQYTRELSENVKQQVLKALLLTPNRAIAKLAKILETERQGNKLLYAAAFYKKLKEQRVQNIEFVGTPRTAEKFEASPSSIINYDYNVLIFGKEPRVVCPIGKTDSVFINMTDLDEKLDLEKRKCAIYDLDETKKAFIETLMNPKEVMEMREEYKELPEQDRYDEEEPDVTFEEYMERKNVVDPDQEKEEFLTDEDFRSNQISHDLGIEIERGIEKIDTIYQLFQKYSNSKYKYNVNKDLTIRQQKELDEILKLEPQKAFEQCKEFLINYQKGNSLIFAGAVLHELMNKGYEAYMAHITLGQNIEDFTDNMLQYEEIYPAFKIDGTDEFYIIEPLGNYSIKNNMQNQIIEEDSEYEDMDTDTMEYVFFDTDEISDKIFIKASEIIGEETTPAVNIKIAFNRFAPYDQSNKPLGDILRTKEIIMKSNRNNIDR